MIVKKHFKIFSSIFVRVEYSIMFKKSYRTIEVLILFTRFQMFDVKTLDDYKVENQQTK